MLSEAYSNAIPPAHPVSKADHNAHLLQLNSWKELNEAEGTHSHPTTPVRTSSSASLSDLQADEALTPLLFTPSQFAQQDIFDMSTFAHLAAETAAEYARRPLKSFPPIGRRRTASDMTSALCSKGNTSEEESEIPPTDASAMRSSRGNGVGARTRPSLCTSTFTTKSVDASAVAEAAASSRRPSLRPSNSTPECAFRQFVAQMKADEVEKLIQSDSSLRRMRTHTASFRSELESLERVFEAKLHTLQREHDQLLVRNEKLAKLSKKVHADQLAQVEARSRSMSIASDVSSCASSPPHSYRRQDSQSSTSSFSAASSRQSTPPGSPASVLHI